jgi:hypothetical protein
LLDFFGRLFGASSQIQEKFETFMELCGGVRKKGECLRIAFELCPSVTVNHKTRTKFANGGDRLDALLPLVLLRFDHDAGGAGNSPDPESSPRR